MGPKGLHVCKVYAKLNCLQWTREYIEEQQRLQLCLPDTVAWKKFDGGQLHEDPKQHSRRLDCFSKLSPLRWFNTALDERLLDLPESTVAASYVSDLPDNSEFG